MLVVTKSLTVNRFFMKLFRTSDIVTVRECQSLFVVDLPSVVLTKRFDKLTARYGDMPSCCVVGLPCLDRFFCYYYVFLLP